MSRRDWDKNHSTVRRSSKALDREVSLSESSPMALGRVFLSSGRSGRSFCTSGKVGRVVLVSRNLESFGQRRFTVRKSSKLFWGRFAVKSLERSDLFE